MKTLLGLSLFFSAFGQATAAAAPPNIVIIFIDDMGYADPSCFGNPVVKTPSIDALAKQGIIREGDWKLLINTDSTDVMLFNLKNDPGETNNLVEKKSQKAKNMAAKVLAWRRSMPVEIPQ